MAVIRRVYVEKKAGYDIEARVLFSDLRDNLSVLSLQRVRILNRYDVSGVSGREMARAGHTIFSEPPVDEIYLETFPLSADETAFAIEYLPGQYDQRADSAVQCLQLSSPGVQSRDSRWWPRPGSLFCRARSARWK